MNSDDGLLVLDRNNDGIINDGKELFGDQTILNNGQKASNGFQALAELDSNADGKIDSNDAVFSQLKVWQDIDGDGYSTDDELKSLSDVGISAINLNSTPATSTDPEGNTQTRIGSFEKADGTTGTIGEYNLRRDTAYTIANEWLDVPEDIASLPDLQGYGNVYDLQQAMVRDTSGQLKSLVEQFIAANDTVTRNSLMEQIFFKWTGVEGISPTSRGGDFDARKLSVLEKFFGEDFVGTDGSNPNVNTAPLLNKAYHGMFEMFYAQITAQTHLKDIYGMIIYTWDEAWQTVKGDLNTVTTEIQNRLNTDYEAGKQVLSEFVRTLRGFQAEDMMNFMTFRSAFALQGEELAWVVDSAGKHVINGTTGNDSLYGANDTLYGADLDDAINGGDGDDWVFSGTGNDTIYGGSGNDYLYSGEGGSTIYGGSGNDYIYSGEGDDIIDGGPGNDYIEGGGGTEFYIFSIGSGQDAIRDMGGYDTVNFGAGIQSSDLELIKENNNLRINFKGATDSIVIKDWFASSAYRVEQFKFADGTVLTPSNLDAMGYKVYGTAGDDSLWGSDANDKMYGYEGNDIIHGESGDDFIDGGAGGDQLYGGDGNDTLIGGIGSDYLVGGNGSDTYRFEIGSGQDTIFDYNGSSDTIEFGAGISSSNLELIKEGANLRINIKGTIGSLIIQRWFSSSAYKIEQFKFADGTVLTSADIEAIGYKIYGTSGNDSLFGLSGNDVIYGYAGNDTLYGNAGDDMLYGGAGSDQLYGTEGDDTLTGGTGNDELIGGEGNDTYIFNIGDGVDTVQDIATAAEGNLIVFGEGITRNDLKLNQNGNVLTIQVGTNGDAIRLVNFDPDNINGSLVVSTVEFADGTQVLLKDLLDPGTEGDDIINTGSSNDVINAKGGNDIVNTDGGNDTITGGRGNDILNGGAGDDTYIFNVGDGIDTINDIATDAEGNLIVFGEGITRDDLRMSYKDNTLIISVGSNGDIVQLSNFNPEDAYGTRAINAFQFADETTLTYNQLIERGFDLTGTAGDDTIKGTNVSDRITSYEGNDTIKAGEGNNIIDAGEGDDIVTAGSGNDTITGGIGNDTLNGGIGDDVYTYNLGDGLDKLNDTAGMDKLTMGQGIDFDHTIIRMDATTAHLRILDNEGNETAQGIDIALNPDESIPVETISFTDGSSFNMNNLVIESKTAYGTNKSEAIRTSRNDDTIYAYQGNDTVYSGLSNDTIYGGNGDDILNGEGGKDTLYGENGNDILNGGSGDDMLDGGNGDDKLYGENGNDILDGGRGNDYLQGDLGSDTYKIGKSSGQDVINDYDTTVGNTDTVKTTEGVSKQDIAFFRKDSDFYIFTGDSDFVKVTNQFNNSNYGIERIEATDGYYVSRQDIENIVNAMIDFNNDSGMDVIQRYNNLQNNQQYMTMLAQSWQQPQNTYTA